MKKIVVFLGLLLFTLQACCQQDKTFKEVVTFEKGFKFTSTGAIQMTPFLGSSSTDVTWDSILDKPLTFAPSSHTHPITEITNIPETDLKSALAQLGIYLDKTTAELDAIVPANGFGIALDKTLNVYKVYKNNMWVTVITNR